tara:strand:+ start:393 stop:611 length:219 start_codon:yes stop_codon:yes gene_type:complete
MAMKPRKMMRGGAPKKMRRGSAPKKMRGGGMAMGSQMKREMMKPDMMAKGGMTVADLRKAAKAKGYKLVKSD